eukprot:2681799-Prymnesium_polylepis.1
MYRFLGRNQIPHPPILTECAPPAWTPSQRPSDVRVASTQCSHHHAPPPPAQPARCAHLPRCASATPRARRVARQVHGLRAARARYLVRSLGAARQALAGVPQGVPSDAGLGGLGAQAGEPRVAAVRRCAPLLRARSCATHVRPAGRALLAGALRARELDDVRFVHPVA